MAEAKRFVVACGGTGGHTFPGLAVASELSSRGHEVVVWNCGRSIEDAVLRGWKGRTFLTKAPKLRLKCVFSLLRSFFRCMREIKRFKPDALLAMGSYSSLPPVLAARSLGVPVALHEANTVPGKAISFLSHLADVVAISFEITRTYLPGKNTVLTGLPVRKNIACGHRFADVDESLFTVFVTGGSQGAHRVNELAMKALKLFSEDLAKRGEANRLYVIHQTGAKDEAEVMRFYASAGIKARVNAFEYEMADAFATADIVIARAGASTCFELALVGKPCFFIPLPTAVRNHQHFNAEAFVSGGAAAEGDQEKLSARSLANYLLGKYSNCGELAKMDEKMKLFAAPNAAADVAKLVESL